VLIAGNVRMTVPPDEIAEVLPVSPSARPPVPSPSVSENAEFEIDLRGLRVDESRNRSAVALDAAVIADNPFLRIIHGKGTGAVRERVHAVLKGDRRVTRYGLAPANQGRQRSRPIVEFAREPDSPTRSSNRFAIPRIWSRSSASRSRSSAPAPTIAGPCPFHGGKGRTSR
jgi:hypothetical protein